MKRKRFPRLAALTIVMLLVIQSLPALAFQTNQTNTFGGGTSAVVSAEDTVDATEVSTQESSNSDETSDEDSKVHEYTYTMHDHNLYIPSLIGQLSSIPDNNGNITSTSYNGSILSSDYFPELYKRHKDDPGFQDTDACFARSRSQTIVSWDCGKDCDDNNIYYNRLIIPSYCEFADVWGNNDNKDCIRDEILACAKANGLTDWSTNTHLSNLTAEFYRGLYFYDKDGKPADFIRKIDGAKAPIWDIGCTNWDNKKFTDGIQRDPVYTKSSFEQECSNIQLMNTNSSETAEGADIGLLPPIYMTSGTYVASERNQNTCYFNRNYLGKLTVKPELRFVFHFTVDGEKYQFTLKTPDISYDFNVVRGKYSHSGEKPDSDVKAVITNNNGAPSEPQTENTQVTAVQHGDKIGYQIDIGTEAEAEMFYQLQNAICKMSTWNFSSEDMKKLEDIDKSYSFPYHDYYQTGTEEPRIKVDFKIPEGLNYDNEINNITLAQERSDTPKWTVDKDNTKYDNTSSTLHVELELKDSNLSNIIKFKPNQEDSSQLADLMNQIHSDKLTLNIPGIEVSDNAEVGKYYTAKAKVSGHMHMDYESVLGVSVPASAKPGGDFDWDDDETSWDEEIDWDDETVRQTASNNSPLKVSAFTLLRALSVSNADSSKSITTQDDTASSASDSSAEQEYSAEDFTFGVHSIDYDASDMVPSLDYTWKHLQNNDGKDYIQEEENSDELWYTVVIPAATISKELPDDASEADQNKEFTFGIQLEDEDLFGQTFDAARGEKQDDGTISYSDTAETVSFNENGYAEIKLKAGEVLVIGLPDGCEYTVKEILDDDSYTVKYSYVSASGEETVSTGTSSSNDGITGKVEAAKYTESDSVDTIDVTATNYPEGNLAISKRVIVPEEELAAEENKEFRFVLTLDNDDFDVNRDYTAKLYTGGVYNSSLGRFEYQDDPAEETMTIQDGKLSFSLKHGQTLEIDGLPDGTSYTVEEVVNHGFTPSYKNQSGTTQAHDTTYALCENAYDYSETTDITVNKVWAGDTEAARPASIQAQLYRNGKTYGDPVTLKKSNDWSYTWHNLDADQEYTVAEVNVPDGYESSVTNENNVWTITNTNQNTVIPDTQSVKVNKVWANDDSSTRPSSVKMQLYQNGSVYGDAVTLSETNNWSYTWTGLESGKNYTVAEVNVPDGYESSVTSLDNVWTVTNTKKDTVTPDKQSVKVNKVWANDDSSTRPSSVQMQLYQNGEVCGDAVTLSEINDWSYTWTGLDPDQKYTVAEVNVPDGYESSVSNEDNVWTVTNTKKGTDTPSDTTTNTPGNPSDTTTNTPGNPSNTTTSTTSNNNSQPAEAANASPAKTGDTSPAGIWLLIILAASAGTIFAVWKKRANR